jgi:glutamate racemase
MIIWFFDSWLGGKLVMEAFQKEFPHGEMILEMDRENAPYGDKSWEDIRFLTKNGVEKLFARWADVVILACNTASVHALRWLQQEIFIGRHILWVTIPWAEAVVEEKYRKIWILATEATVRIRAYKERVHILDESIIVEEIGAPGLVPLIEQGITSGFEIETFLRQYLFQFSPDIDALVLGCTHYPLIQESIEKIWQDIHYNSWPHIIDPGRESAKKFHQWLARKEYILR